MNNTTNALNWFEIATNDLDRAQRFYETVFRITMEAMDLPDISMRTFPADGITGKVGGAIVRSAMHKPGKEGTLVYLNANPDLSDPLSRIEGAGGRVLLPKTHVSEEIGHMAIFEDCEGNIVALHSQG